tara:strand:+ start:1253 stop:1666 length:414 start_codon:yes stop_codon:yes gene_type:complete
MATELKVDTDEEEIKMKEERERLICNYHKSLIGVEESNIDDSKKDIDVFKREIETEIGKLQGKIDQINTLSVTQETELEALEKKRQDLENNNSFNSGPQLKKDIYEENTNLTMSLIYYVLGIGFMGYYIVKTLKKTA